MEIDKLIETDVLVIGSGIAGARAAIAARERSVDVVLVTKSQFCSGCTSQAASFAAVSDPWKASRDNTETYFLDLLRSGDWLNDQRLAKILAERAAEEALFMERIGLLWDRLKDGRTYYKRLSGGHSNPRGLMVGDITGLNIQYALKGELIKSNVKIMEEIMITSLLTCEGSVVGATGIDIVNGDFMVLKAKSTILGTGGAGQLYPITTNSAENTGDGYAMAYRAGAELIDMEFVQFYPGGLIWPPEAKGKSIGTEIAAGLENVHGERFMKKWDPERMHHSTRDTVTKAIWTEVTEGKGTPHGGVYLDWTDVPADLIERAYPFRVEMWAALGNDPRVKKKIEIAPTAHFFMGGVKVNERCESSLPRLYVAGQAIGGIHGANRLGGCSLPSGLVFGAIGGTHAAERALEMDMPQIDYEQVNEEHKRVNEILNREQKNGLREVEVRKKLHDTSHRHLFVLRDAQGLEKAISKIDKIRKKDLPRISLATNTKKYNQELLKTLELYNLLDVAEMVARAALMRTETRGAHVRTDFPREDEKFLQHIIIQKRNNRMTLRTEPVEFTLLKPREV